VKKERKIDPGQSVLIVSSKANFRANLRKRRKTTPKPSLPEKLPNDDHSVADESKRLDVPYRLAVNSRYLLDTLGQWVGPELSETRNVLVRPFKYLVFYEQEIRQFYQDLEAQVDAETDAEQGNGVAHATEDLDSGQETAKQAASRAKRERDEFRCVIEFMDRDMADIFDIKRQIIDKTLNEIAFEHLWQLFRPGQAAYQFPAQDHGGRCQAFRILHVTGGRACFDFGKQSFDPVRARDFNGESETEERCREIVRSSDNEITAFIIDCFSIDFDGHRVGPKPKRFAIQRYQGTRPIKILALYPAVLHPDDQQIQKQLQTRGRRFSELAPGVHKRYDGHTLRESNHVPSSYKNYLIDQAEVCSSFLALHHAAKADGQ